MSDTPPQSSGNRGLIGILLCLVLGGLVALAGSDGGLRLNTALGPLPLFALCGMVGFVLHWLIFVPSFVWQTEHYFDLTARWNASDNFSFTFTIQNLLNNKPKVVGNTIGSTSFNSGNVFPSTYDALGRRFGVAAKLTF